MIWCFRFVLLKRGVVVTNEFMRIFVLHLVLVFHKLISAGDQTFVNFELCEHYLGGIRNFKTAQLLVPYFWSHIKIVLAWMTSTSNIRWWHHALSGNPNCVWILLGSEFVLTLVIQAWGMSTVHICGTLGIMLQEVWWEFIFEIITPILSVLILRRGR